MPAMTALILSSCATTSRLRELYLSTGRPSVSDNGSVLLELPSISCDVLVLDKALAESGNRCHV